MITTANSFFNMTWEEYNQIAVMPQLSKYGIEPGLADDGLILAYVNHGRWLVKCECGGAEKMFEEGIFMCQSCYNAGHKHKHRHAVFPKQRRQVEAILLRRPIPNRNWQLGETLAQLKQENEQHKEELL